MARKCSVERALAVIGERWTLLILREVFLGVRRFEAIHQNTGAPRAILVRRLRALEDADLLSRQDYQDDGSRTRQEYRLTDAGRELQPVLTALMQWGDTHCADQLGAPLVLTHKDCGAPVRASLVCADGHHLDDSGRALTARQVL